MRMKVEIVKNTITNAYNALADGQTELASKKMGEYLNSTKKIPQAAKLYELDVYDAKWESLINEAMNHLVLDKDETTGMPRKIQQTVLPIFEQKTEKITDEFVRSTLKKNEQNIDLYIEHLSEFERLYPKTQKLREKIYQKKQDRIIYPEKTNISDFLRNIRRKIKKSSTMKMINKLVNK